MLIRYDPSATRPQTVLVVCTANVCRSPLVQGVLRRGLTGAGWLAEVEVVSAGTAAEPDHAMCELSAERLGDEAFAVAHASRELTKQGILAADLVVTMEREQRGEVARTAPGSQSKVFTLREAAALAEAAAHRVEAGEVPAPEDLRRLAQLLHSTRGTVPITAPKRGRGHWWQRRQEPDDPLTIGDGHGRSPAEHAEALAEAADAAEGLAARLTAIVTAAPTVAAL